MKNADKGTAQVETPHDVNLDAIAEICQIPTSSITSFQLATEKVLHGRPLLS
jgi:hypothetical protein